MSLLRLRLVTGLTAAMLFPTVGFAQTIDLPGGGKVIIRQETSTDGGSVKETEVARGTGASGTASGDKAELGIDGTAPTASLSGRSSASGGSINATGSAKLNASLFGNPLLWAGLLSWLGAAVSVYLRLPIRTTIIAAGSGVAFICAALFPVATMFLVGGSAVAVVGFYVWSERNAADGAKAREALRAVVAGIANAPTGAAEVVKAEVAKQADDQDKLTIKSIKRKDGLP